MLSKKTYEFQINLINYLYISKLQGLRDREIIKILQMDRQIRMNNKDLNVLNSNPLQQ